MKIPIDMIDPNPHQIREIHDDKMIAGIAVSALGRHGILQSPMVRMKDDGRFETVYGHGRVRAAKVAGIKELECRVESDVTDREMRLYMGQENLLRTNLTEKERIAWLEQVQEDMGLTLGDPSFFQKIHQKTALPVYQIEEAYYVNKVRKRLVLPASRSDEVSVSLIVKTRGLTDEDQDKLIIKTMAKGWGVLSAFKIKMAIKDVDPELRAKLLDKETDLPWKVMVAISGIEFPENALKIIDFIITRRLTEKTALTIIEDAKEGIYPRYEVKEYNKFEETYRKFRLVNSIINGWNLRKYEIVKESWDEIEPILTNIETKIQEFRRLNLRV